MRRFLINLILLSLLCVVSNGGLAAESSVFPFPVKAWVLPNGLQVVSVETPTPGVVALLTIVRVGARNEVEAGCSGFAHFFEHMMFKGTKTFSGKAREQALMKMGAESNAFTSEDFTCYHVVAGIANLNRLLQIESDRFQHLEYTPAALKTEAAVILGEYQKDASSPFEKLFEKLQKTAFTTHPYQHTVIGFKEDIEHMPEKFEFSREFFRRFYRPDNCILLLAGDVKNQPLSQLVQKWYGTWKSNGAPAEIPAEPQQKAERRAEILWPSPTQPLLVMGYHVPAFSESNREVAALTLLNQVLFSSIAHLYQQLVLKDQLVEFVSGGYDAHRDPSLFTVLTRIKDPKKIKDVEGCIENALAEIISNPPSGKRLEDLKSNVRYSKTMELTSPAGIAFALASYLQLTGKPDSMNAFYDELQKVQPEDLRRVASTYLIPSNRTVVTLTSQKKGNDQ